MNDPLYTIVSLADWILTLLTYAIIGQAILSWIRPDPNNYFVRLLNKITDPILRPLERLIPPFGGLSITPIIAIVGLQFIQGLLPRLLY